MENDLTNLSESEKRIFRMENKMDQLKELLYFVLRNCNSLHKRVSQLEEIYFKEEENDS